MGAVPSGTATPFCCPYFDHGGRNGQAMLAACTDARTPKRGSVALILIA